MDETTSNSTSTSSSPAAASVGIWLAASVIGTVAISLAAAQAPPRIRLIGLFSLAFGALIGWGIARLADKLHAHSSRMVMGLVAAACCLAGLIGTTWETVRLDTARAPKSDKELLAARLFEQMRAQTDQPVPAEDKWRPVAEFRRYLSRRIRPLGDWTSPWPEAFWCAELLVASTAAAWTATRQMALITAMAQREQA